MRTALSASIELIDEEHANARRAWVQMGEPERPLPHQVSVLELASALTPEPVALRTEGDAAILEFELMPQATALLTVQL